MSPPLFPTTIHESLFAFFVSCDLAMTVWKARRFSCALLLGVTLGPMMEMVRVWMGITVKTETGSKAAQLVSDTLFEQASDPVVTSFSGDDEVSMGSKISNGRDVSACNLLAVIEE